MIIYNVYTLYKRCTIYTYGLERISALTAKTKTEYVYDGRGSVAAEVSYNNSWYTLGGALSKKDISSKSYTPLANRSGSRSPALATMGSTTTPPPGKSISGQGSMNRR